MKSTDIKQLVAAFEAVRTEIGGVECQSARDLQSLPGYSKRENFEKVIDKAKEACKNAGREIADRFPDIRKMVNIGSGMEREIMDMVLTRYACYLVANHRVFFLKKNRKF